MPAPIREVSAALIWRPKFRSAARLRLALLLLSVGLGLAVLSTPTRGQDLPRFRIREEQARQLFQKGLVFHNAMQYIAAREFFYKALDVQPYFHLARRYLGDSYYYSGDWNGALEQWEFLDEVSSGAYPLVRQRSEMLRFYLNQYINPGDYIYLKGYATETWTGYSFSGPTDVATDDENRLYILSYGSANMIHVDSSGRAFDQTRGLIWDRLQGPIAMARHGNELFVADYTADRVRVFNLEGRELRSFGQTGSEAGNFRGPSGITVSGDAVYVSDAGNHRVQKFDSEGRHLLTFGSNDLGQAPRYPAGIAALEDVGVFVADRDDGRILHFDPDGNYLGSLESGALRKPHGLEINGDRLIVADEEAGILLYHFSTQIWRPLPELRDASDRPLRLERPFAARMDQNGVLYVADYGAGAVRVLIPRGLKVANLDLKIQRVDASGFPHVGVFLSVRNRLGNTIRGLGRADFFLYENDRRVGRIRTDNVVPYNRRVHIVITKENTPLFQEEYDRYLPGALAGLLDPLRTADALGIVRVGEQVRQIYSGLERRHILRLLAEGDTAEEPNLGKGLYESITLLVREIGPRSVNLVVSGEHFPGAFNQYSQQKVTQYARANGIQINVISFESDQDPEERERARVEFEQMARLTGGRYYRAFDESALTSLYDSIRQSIDDRYILTYDSFLEEDLANHYVDIRIEVRHLGSFGLADAGYFVP